MCNGTDVIRLRNGYWPQVYTMQQSENYGAHIFDQQTVTQMRTYMCPESYCHYNSQPVKPGVGCTNGRDARVPLCSGCLESRSTNVCPFFYCCVCVCVCVCVVAETERESHEAAREFVHKMLGLKNTKMRLVRCFCFSYFLLIKKKRKGERVSLSLSPFLTLRIAIVLICVSPVILFKTTANR